MHKQAFTTLENSVTIEIDEIPANTTLVLRYEFSAKEMTPQFGSLSDQDNDNPDPHQCNLPYFTQELAILDTRVLR